jgi:predicted nucleotidyltransferase
MTDVELVSGIRNLAEKTNGNLGHHKWYFFGSAKLKAKNTSDIDLLVVCQTHRMADEVRTAVDLDQFSRPIHLSILTQTEESEVGFVERYECTRIV